MFSRTVATGQLVGRETEKKELQEFMSTRIENGSSGCLYISGPPGTGKSAMVNEMTSEYLESGSAKMAYVNCMSVKSARDMCLKLLEEFGALDEELEGSPLELLKQLLTNTMESRLVVLDEVDHLLDVDLELLYSIFEWALDPSSSLILIGIANALDLTDRFLPRLKSRGLKPDLLPFMPYTAPQIVSVLNSKLRSLLPTETATPDLVPFLHPAAVQFISKKVASQTGDLRKAFEIARRAIDLVESETRDQHLKKIVEQTPTPSPSPSKTPLVENMNLSSPPTPRRRGPSASGPALALSLAQLTVETAPRATIAHAARVTASAFNNGSSTRLRGLNLQQKAVLCALASLERKLRMDALSAVPMTPSKTGRAGDASATAPTIKSLYSSYTAACKRDNALHPLTATEFRDVVSNLETLSLVAAVDGRSSSTLGGSATPVGTPSRRGRKPAGFGTVTAAGWGEDRRVASRVGEKELATGLEGVGSGILKQILDEEH
jgi:cell division control protein 6